MRILYLSQFFLPEIAAGTSRAHGLAREWTKLGHEVTVLTFFPHYPKGLPYPGFDYGNRLWKEESIEGIRVLRGFNLFYRPGELWKRVLDLPVGVVSSTATGLLDRLRHDIIVASSPQPHLFASALALGAIKKLPVVLEVRDHWPEAVSKGVPLSQLAVPPARWMIRQAYKKASLVVGVSPFYRDVFARYGVPPQKQAIFENGLDEEQFPGIDGPDWRQKLGLEGKFVVSFIGTIGRNMGLETVLDVAGRMQKTQAHFLFVGHGATVETLKEQAHAQGLKNVTFHPPVNRNELADVYRTSDVSLACLGDHQFHLPRVPAKLWEILGMGIPMVLCAPKGAANHIAVEQANGALWVPPDDPDRLESALQQLMNDAKLRDTLASNGFEYVHNGYTRAQIAGRYAERLEELV